MITEVIKIIQRYRFSLSSEWQLQNDVERVLIKHEIPYKREYVLDKKNRPDFMIYGYAVEIKIGGTATNIYKQCSRYAAFEQVDGVVLITNRAMGFPTEIHGKPAYLVSLGGAWL